MKELRLHDEERVKPAPFDWRPGLPDHRLRPRERELSARIFPGRWERLYWPFDDPAEFKGGRDEVLARFRAVRDEIRGAIETWLDRLKREQATATA